MTYGDVDDILKTWNFGASSRHPPTFLIYIFYEFDNVDEIGFEASKHLAMNDNQYMLGMSE